MLAELISVPEYKIIGRIEAPGGPVCGVDFCESCEDCMSCCYCGHPRIVYADELDQFLAEHEDAVVHMIEEAA